MSVITRSRIEQHAFNERHPQFRHPDVKVLNPAPEICVEVLSPSNSAEDIELKRRLYFEEGAQEIWICGLEGQMKFFSPVGELEASKVCPKFRIGF